MVQTSSNFGFRTPASRFYTLFAICLVVVVLKESLRTAVSRRETRLLAAKRQSCIFSLLLHENDASQFRITVPFFGLLLGTASLDPDLIGSGIRTSSLGRNITVKPVIASCKRLTSPNLVLSCNTDDSIIHIFPHDKATFSSHFNSCPRRPTPTTVRRFLFKSFG